MSFGKMLVIGSRCAFGMAAALLSLWILQDSSLAGEPPPRQVAAEIKALTGAHTRMAWLQDGDENVHSWGCGPKTLIMGFDTDDGKGVRAIVADQSGCAGPVFTPDGKGLVFTRIDWGPPLKRHLMYVNWDGTGLREIAPGWFIAAAVADPKEGFTWLYGLAEVEGGGLLTKRIRMDKPEVVEALWDKADGPGGMTVSPDGRYVGGVYNFAAGNAPCGVYELPNVAYVNVAHGCLPCMLPCTAPYRLFIANGDHRSGNIYTNPADKEKMTTQRVSLVEAPMADNKWEVHTPRWSNNVRFLVLSAPFTPGQNDQGIPFPGGEGNPKYRRDYDKVEISIGRLDEDLTKIEKWVRITYNNKGDYLPQAWIDPGKGAASSKATPAQDVKQTPRLTAWPPDRAGLVYLYERMGEGIQNDVVDGSGQSRMCLPEPRDHATYGRFGVMDLVNGSFVAMPEETAVILDSCRKSGAFSLEMTLQPDRVDLDKPAAIMSFASEGSGNFVLGMEKNRLVMRLLTSEHKPDSAVKVAALKAGVLQHVIIAYEAGKLACYIDGQNKATNGTIKGNLGGWSSAPLVFGDHIGRGQDWPGTLEGIAVYSRALDAKQANAHAKAYQARVEKRRPAARIVVDAKLFEITPNSTPEAIVPYHRLLLVDNFEVVKVVKGKCDHKTIGVAGWGILDDKVLELNREKGKTYRLVIEPLSDHPQLEIERVLNATQDQLLPFYYNVVKP